MSDGDSASPPEEIMKFYPDVQINYSSLSALNKKDRQLRYREQHREKLKQREAERRKSKRIILLQPTTSCSDFNSTGQASHNEHSSENVDMKSARIRERQRKYRERHREQLKLREAERRKNKQNVLFQPTTSCSDFNSTGQASHNEHSSENVDMKSARIRERQRKYRERHREQLKLREAERRKNKQNVLFQPTTSCSDFNSTGQASHNEHSSENVDMKSARIRERQRKYRERHREQLKLREAERRKNKQNVLFQPTTSCSDFNSTGQASHNEHSSENVDMKSARIRERQRKYRELHREQLKQREAERRKNQKNVQQREYDSEEAERRELVICSDDCK